MKDQIRLSHNRGDNLSIDPERLWDDILQTASFGATPKGGICRLTLSDEDRAVRDWFKSRAESIGCTVTVDDMGNIFARRAGLRNDVPPIAMGSHLDTQPTGGRFDGVLGVIAALEVLRTLQEAGYETFAPIEVVNFTNEEGSRFAPAMMASAVFARAIDRHEAVAQTDRAGISFGEALERIGYRGPQACGEHPLSGFFELHIEQGPILERERKDVGVVSGVQGMRWYEATLSGQEAHTGATPMTMRRNALLGAARMVATIDTVAKKHGPLAVGTVGLIEVKPNSRNVIPAEVFFTVDFRHPESQVLDEMEAEAQAAFNAAILDFDLSGEWKRIWNQPPVRFDTTCIDAVRNAARSCGYSARDIISGAGHDAAYSSRVAPTAMIFVPCTDGISHNEAEFTSKEQCAVGAQVLMNAVLDFDQRLQVGRAKLSI